MSIDPSSIRILVVDDEKMILDVFSSRMRQFHYHADFFADPEKAYETAKSHPSRYDLLVTDISMPGGDGIQFARRMREIFPNLPVLFMTGFVTEERRQAALQMGNVLFLEKPFPLADTLQQAISKFLSR